MLQLVVGILRKYQPANQSFKWRSQPSTTGAALGRTKTTPKTKPVSLTFSKRVHSSSIASAEPLKRKPGVGRNGSV